MSYQSLIERKLTPQGVSGNEIIYPCPWCEDIESGHHMYVNYHNNKMHCFKCGSGGKLPKLIRKLGLSLDFDYDNLYSDQDKELSSILKDFSKKKVELKKVDYSTDLEVLTTYFCQHIRPLSQEALDYLRNVRHLSDNQIQSLRIYEGSNQFGRVFNIKGKDYVGRDYSGRILLPSILRDKVAFYLARDYTGTKEPKYLNPPKELAVASEDVWGLDGVIGDIIVVCEGAFTAVAVNTALHRNIAVATYGKSIAGKSSETEIRVTSQGEKLLAKDFGTYIMFYDRDAQEECYKNGKYLADRGANVRMVQIPKDWTHLGDHADAADMTDDEIKQCIRDSVPIDQFLEILT